MFVTQEVALLSEYFFRRVIFHQMLDQLSGELIRDMPV